MRIAIFVLCGIILALIIAIPVTVALCKAKKVGVNSKFLKYVIRNRVYLTIEMIALLVILLIINHYVLYR